VAEPFEILVREYHHMVFAYVLALVNDPHLAEDLTQEVFLVAHRRMADYDTTRDFGAWVRGIARRLVMAQQRRTKRFRFVQLEKVEASLTEAFTQPDEAAPSVWQRRTAALRECLEKADRQLRKLLDLHYTRRLGAALIAEQFGIGVAAVWKRLSRARLLLRQCIDRTLQREGTAI
jgi:RNA polymerase sigma-70 factor (ECF subfamily)